jgi:hypothetical protein
MESIPSRARFLVIVIHFDSSVSLRRIVDVPDARPRRAGSLTGLVGILVETGVGNVSNTETKI